jgi:hypothetical protein
MKDEICIILDFEEEKKRNVTIPYYPEDYKKTDEEIFSNISDSVKIILQRG